MAAWIRTTACALLVSMGSMSLPANAAMIPTDAALGQSVPSATARERAELAAFVARDDVREQLTRMGVDAADADSRLAALTDDEVRQLHGKMDSLPAGGSILGVVVFVFVLLLITDILGFTKVFPFTRSVR